jgi:glycosyltransferase involved in cell wall biosynthesis
MKNRVCLDEFKNLYIKNLGYHLCFVNDGSKDKTLEVLQELRKGKEEYISIYDCENGGKASGKIMSHLAKANAIDYIGF